MWIEKAEKPSDMDRYYSGSPRSGGKNSLYENVANVNGPSGDGLKGFKSSSSHRISESLASTGKLAETQNPYALYNSIDNDSLDDGIHMDLSTGDSGLGDMGNSSDQPSDDLVLREFAEYMDVISPISEPEEVALRSTSIQEKWTLLVNQKNRSPIFNVRYYIENLRQNQGTRRKKFSIGKSTRSGGLGYVLHKLKLDLKMSPKSFLVDFMKEPNCGLHLLVRILSELQRDKNVLNTARKSKKDEMEKSLDDEEDCLLCLRFLLRIEEGVKAMSNEDGVYDLVAQTTLSTKATCRTVSLKILSLLCRFTPSGFHRVMEAMGRQQQKLNEDVMFRTLCTTMNTKDHNTHVPFVTSAVAFFNALILSASNASGRVHVQHQLEMAGFNLDQLETLARGPTFEHDELSREVDRWKHIYIDVTTMKDEKTALESRNKLLRDEVYRKEEQVKSLEKFMRQKDREQKKTDEKSEEYRERAAELQDTVEKLRKMYEENTGRTVAEGELNVEEVLKPLDGPVDSSASKYSSVRSISTVSGDVPDAPPLPPAAPPLYIQPKKKKVPTATLR